MLWIGMIIVLFIMACMVAMALILFNIIERIERIEDGKVDIKTYRQNMKSLGEEIRRVQLCARKDGAK